MPEHKVAINFDKTFDESLKDISGGILLHACCGPCATAVVEKFITTVRPTLYYFNPNIYPKSEYDLRLENLKTVAKFYDVPLVWETYDESQFYDAVQNGDTSCEGGERCTACFYLRLRKTALKAKELGISTFCSTLTVSPKKNAQIINEVGMKIEHETGVRWLCSDFKKRNGYVRSVELSKQMDLYRQHYCGCVFSKRESNL